MAILPNEEKEWLVPHKTIYLLATEAPDMLELLPDHKNDPEHMQSIGQPLNLGVNELADVLHTFFLNVVKEEQ